MTLETGNRTHSSLLCGALTLLVLVFGCDEISRFVEEASAADEPVVDSPSAPPVEAVEEPLPERPDDSIARSETSVITFQSILEDREMSRAERIRAFENLDPAALQKPIAQPNVSGAPKVAGQPRRRPSASQGSERKAKAIRSNIPVVMYSTDWCGVCKRARKYFEEQGIRFTEYDVDRNLQARNEYLLLNPRRSVPTIKIGNEVIVGFSPPAVEAALSAAAR